MATTVYQLKEPKACFFLTLVEVNATCICRNHSQITHDPMYYLVKNVVAHELAIAIVGIVLTLCGLAVVLNIVRKRGEEKEISECENQCCSGRCIAGTACQVSVLSVFNVLRLVAVFMAGLYTVRDERPAAQKVCNHMWLLGTWGAGYTMLDLCVGRFVQQWRPRWLHLYVFRMTAIRAFVALLLGFLLHGKVIVHAVVSRSRHCDEDRYWWGYEAYYSLYVVMIVHYVVPTLLMSLFTLGQLVISVQNILWDSTFGKAHHKCMTHSGDRHPECFVLLLSVWFSASHSLAAVAFFTIMMQPDSIHFPHSTEYKTQKCVIISELICVINACTTVLLYFLWPRFREELISILRDNKNIIAFHAIPPPQ